MTRKYLFLLLFICISTAAICQEKFIEITVSDTILAKANLFVYTVIANPVLQDGDTSIQNNVANMQKIFTAQARQGRLMADSFRNVLLLKGFRLLPASRTAKSDDGFYSVQVLTSSMDSVRQVHNLIKKNKNFMGEISMQRVTNTDSYMQKLRARIIEKAKLEVARMATLKGVTMGNILSIKEIRQDNNHGWTAYPPLSNLGKGDTLGEHSIIYPANNKDEFMEPHFYPIKKTLVIRFAIK